MGLGNSVTLSMSVAGAPLGAQAKLLCPHWASEQHERLAWTSFRLAQSLGNLCVSRNFQYVQYSFP